eukprot:NODE_2281_length_806_cov_222.184941_g1594_i0.p1 GENE.NODE_2281_length_806_cov_222.184941_g1594_i0~~NODE_2281_length_806_cov_222.184941_g1594_i0.p1  ORF type:complete len:233 (+),score=37.62 NODE_2281_length_806_cov_222.184941_g1594_i0:50-748(+)
MLPPLRRPKRRPKTKAWPNRQAPVADPNASRGPTSLRERYDRGKVSTNARLFRSVLNDAQVIHGSRPASFSDASLVGLCADVVRVLTGFLNRQKDAADRTAQAAEVRGALCIGENQVFEALETGQPLEVICLSAGDCPKLISKPLLELAYLNNVRVCLLPKLSPALSQLFEEPDVMAIAFKKAGPAGLFAGLLPRLTDPGRLARLHVPWLAAARGRQRPLVSGTNRRKHIRF